MNLEVYSDCFLELQVCDASSFPRVDFQFPPTNKLTESLQILLEVITGNHFPISRQIRGHVGWFLLWTAAGDGVQKMLSKTPNLNQAHFNLITCCLSFFSFFFNGKCCCYLPLPSQCQHYVISQSPPWFTVLDTRAVHDLHNVNTCVLYVGEFLHV